MRGALVAACAVLVLALFPAVALAATCPRTSLSDVEKEVMCPVCGTPLGLATEAPQAERERELIRRLVEDCRSKEEVKERLVAEFGTEVLALPGDDGFDLAAYIVPALALLLAGGALAAAALGWRRVRGGHTDLTAKAPSAAASERLQSDLDRYDA
ncbi:MAG: cytochrome c-type biogenesis protein CcmH [Thermoleophilaceae bacterium]